jgi:hypothetical protein
MTDINDLAQEIYDTNERNGFHQSDEFSEEQRGFYWATKLALIDTEVAEAIEEIRAGKSIDDRYLSYKPVPPTLAVEFSSGAEAREYWEGTQVGKPEGPISEIVDIIIRALDMLKEAKVDPEEVIRWKLAYNQTRELKHGKKF